MREPRAVRTAGGDVELRYLPPLLAHVLRELPSLLSGESPLAKERLFPDAYPEEGEESEEWRRLAVPELQHLFESATTIVTGDLEGMRRDRATKTGFRLPIPAAHLPAWLSSLAAARVALGATHDLDAEDMDRRLPVVVEKDEDRAVLFIHLLGWAQGLLVEATA